MTPLSAKSEVGEDLDRVIRNLSDENMRLRRALLRILDIYEDNNLSNGQAQDVTADVAKAALGNV